MVRRGHGFRRPRSPSHSSASPSWLPGGGPVRVRAATLALTVLVAALAASLVAMAFAHYRADRDAAIADVRSDVAADAVIETRLVRDQFSLLGSLAVTDSLLSGDATRISALLERTDPDVAGLTGGLAWVDAEGTLRARSSGPTPAVSFTDRDWFQAARAGEQFVGAAVRSRVQGVPAVTLAVPVTASGQVVGVLAGGFLLDRAGAILTTLGRPNGTRLVLDRAGQVIVSTVGTERGLRRVVAGPWSGLGARSGGGVRVGVMDPIGRPNRVVAWEAVPAAGWVTMRSVAESRVLSEARSTFVRSLVAVTVLGVLVIAGAWIAARRLRRRLASAAAAAGRQADLATAMALVGAATTQVDVARAVVDHALPAVGARAGGISCCDADRTFLQELHRHGYEPRVSSEWHRFPITTATPAGASVISGAPVYVTDADLSVRFPAAAAALRSTADRSWAALPLRNGAEVLGTLAASFPRANAFDGETRYALELLAERTAMALVRAQRQEREHEATVAFHASLLTGPLDAVDGVVVDAVYQPGDVSFGIGGDWYDTVRIDEHRLAVMVGDVVGHGVAAAAAMGQLRAAARVLVATSPLEGLFDGLDLIAGRAPSTLAASLCCAIVDTASFTVQYVHAGHPPIAAIRTDGTVTLLEPAQRPLLGLASRPTQSRRLPLEDLRALVLYSDGLVERRNESLDVCLERLTTLLTDGVPTAQEILERCGAESSADDIVVMRVDLTGAATAFHDLFGELRVTKGT